MAYPIGIYQKAAEILESRKNKARSEHETRREKLISECPEYSVLENALSKTAQSIVRAMSADDRALMEKQLSEIKKENLEIQDKIRRLLRDAGRREDYLDTPYICPVCRDSGVFEGRLCGCHLKLLRELAYSELCRTSSLKLSSFEDLRLSYYPNTGGTDGESPRTRMKSVIEYCRHYAEDFSRASESLFMYGPTGLGKTHLSLAVAGVVIERGYGVIYGSAGNLLSALEREHFGKGLRNGDYTEDMLLDCDLLILDDLGTEFPTQFTLSKIYNIINTRWFKNLPTVINTNLSFQELEEKYTPRITSRIIGDYRLIRFCGKDIRQEKQN